MTSRPIASVLLLSFCTFSLSAAERPARNVLRPVLPFAVVDGVHSPDRVIVKFVEGVEVRRTEGRWVASSGASMEGYTTLVAGATVERVFTRSVADLDAERAALIPRTPIDYPLPADLNNYYRIHTRGPDQTSRLVNELNGMSLIETAYAELSRESLVPLGSDLAPPTPLFEALQTYTGAAPLGLGYDAVCTIVGATAPDIQVGHLEAHWHFFHEDACQLIPASVVGSQPTNAWNGWKDHGDAVAGILTADRNEYGVRGMSHAADLLLGSLESGAANMISLATNASSAGDVWVSSFAWGLDTGVQAPVDWPQAEFDAVFTAAMKGIVYCFGSANTNADLGNVALYGTRYVPGAPDSGGVIVGAGNKGNLDKISFSNYGARVDCHAWGEGITTLGDGTLFNPGDEKQLYEVSFGGTSGAGPLVAGIAAAISNVLREQNGTALTAFQIRDLLRNQGTPQGAGGHIGPRVDLVKALALHGLPDGLIVVGDADIGQVATIELSGTPGAPVVLFVSAGRGRFNIGLNRPFLLDPTQMVVLGGLAHDPSGTSQISGTIPMTAALKGISLYMQVADTQPSGANHLSNSVELWVRG